MRPGCLLIKGYASDVSESKLSSFRLKLRYQTVKWLIVMASILYCELNQAAYGDMPLVGSIIRGAWSLGKLPQDGSYESRPRHRLQLVYDQTQAEWDNHKCLAAGLPEGLKQYYDRIFTGLQRMHPNRDGILNLVLKNRMIILHTLKPPIQ